MQTRFACDEGVYKAFLEILNMYRKGQKTINNVYELVRRQGFSAPAWRIERTQGSYSHHHHDLALAGVV